VPTAPRAARGLRALLGPAHEEGEAVRRAITDDCSRKNRGTVAVTHRSADDQRWGGQKARARGSYSRAREGQGGWLRQCQHGMTKVRLSGVCARVCIAAEVG
jgi:hypothetical protein